MNVYPDAEIIQEVAIELGVEPSFVEKDWYAVQALKLLAENKIDDFSPIFSGGTSLSKGYGLIQRFSEDLDFKVCADTPKNKNACKAFRTQIIELIHSCDYFNVDPETVISRDGSRFFSFHINYPQTHDLDSALRPCLKLEMRVQNAALDSEAREITSFINQLSESGHETIFGCVSPVETAADKFSALIWRIQGRDRLAPNGTTANDPTMIRHLHDLYALKDYTADQKFTDLVVNALQNDLGRGGSSGELTLVEAVDATLAILKNEERQYREEYRKFVEAMSYADDAGMIQFEAALNSFFDISKIIKDRLYTTFKKAFNLPLAFGFAFGGGFS